MEPRGTFMIIGSFFDGDENKHLMRLQHDIYSYAIGLMITICNRFSHCVAAPADIKNKEKWGVIDKCDHRTIQFAHDLLATAYRFKHEFKPQELALDNGFEPQQLWKNWRIGELLSWKKAPSIVQNFLIIMTNQNERDGYIAESKICIAIMERFPDVPWESGLLNVFKKGLEGDLLTHDLGDTRH